MKLDCFLSWVALSTGVWLSEWIFPSHNYGQAAEATFWIGVAALYFYFKFRHYKPVI